MTATVTIEVARRDDVVRVPSAALRFMPAGAAQAADRRAAGARVWRLAQGQLADVAVVAGLADGQHTEILDGALQVGDAVAVRSASADQSARATSGAAPRSPAAAGSPFSFMQPPGPPR
jgi:HlyD family secretion protein